MPNKKSKNKSHNNGNRPRNGSRSKNARVGADAFLRPVEQRSTGSPSQHTRTYEIPDLRLEHPTFSVHQSVKKDKDGTDHVRYEVEGDLNASVPPIRDSKFLSKQQSIEIYRYMLLNRKMEVALENLYKQGKVVGGVYFGLGQEACSCASALPDRVASRTIASTHFIVRMRTPHSMACAMVRANSSLR